MNVLAVTGHRPSHLGGTGPEVLKRCVTLAREVLFEGQPRRAIIGMAIGWDQAAAQACIDLNVPFVAAIPFAGQERVWPIEVQRHYHWLLERASEIVTISNHTSSIREAMQARNEWMVDHGESLLALWDGSESGTANCVRYARAKGKPIINIWDRWASGLPSDLWELVG